MDGELYFRECEIAGFSSDLCKDREIGFEKRIIINLGSGFCYSFKLNKKIVCLLEKIFDAKEFELKGKDIIEVTVNHEPKAIGYQGLYIPLCEDEDFIEIMSETQLCEFLSCNNIKRINKKDQEIVSYEVQTIIINNRR